MGAPTLHEPVAPPFRLTARLIGAFSAASGLVLASVTAQSLTLITRRDLRGGLALLAGVLLLRWLITLWGEQWAERCAQLQRDYLRAHLLGHFFRPRSANEGGRGDLVTAIERVAQLPLLTSLESSARVALLGIGVVIWAAGWLSGAIVMVLLLAAVPLYRRAGQRSATLEAQYRTRRELLEARQLELLHHAPDIRALGAVNYGANEIAAISDSEHEFAGRAVRVALGSSLVTEFLSGVSVGLVAMVVGFGLLHGTISLFRALTAVLVASELFSYVRRFGVEFHRRDDALAANNMLAISNPPVASRSTSVHLIASHALVTIANALPLSCTIAPVSRTLITGPSGSGKTTLLHTLVGWCEPLSGTVDRSSSAVGFVGAESQLLSTTLRENLELGQSMPDAVLHEQLRALGLSSERFVHLDQPLLADGRGLSSGERVRLLLARNLLARPALLVIDDIAGLLDEPTRTLVRAALLEQSTCAVLEATVDTPLLTDVDLQIELT